MNSFGVTRMLAGGQQAQRTLQGITQKFTQGALGQSRLRYRVTQKCSVPLYMQWPIHGRHIRFLETSLVKSWSETKREKFALEFRALQKQWCSHHYSTLERARRPDVVYDDFGILLPFVNFFPGNQFLALLFILISFINCYYSRNDSYTTGELKFFCLVLRTLL